jgi:hypothetical protein
VILLLLLLLLLLWCKGGKKGLSVPNIIRSTPTWSMRDCKLDM